METENLNSSIVMHREFARIVSDTVDSFSLWFVFHWILYGLTTIVALVVVASHFGGERNVIKEIYLCFFLGIHLFMFVFPCGCAAYITSTCNGKIAQSCIYIKAFWNLPLSMHKILICYLVFIMLHFITIWHKIFTILLPVAFTLFQATLNFFYYKIYSQIDDVCVACCY